MPDYRAEARRAAKAARISPEIYERLIQQESGFRPYVVSKAGARGIAQFMPATAKGLGIDPDNPIQALRGSAQLLSRYLSQYGGDWTKALTAYNAGPGRVGKPLYPETKAYIQKILGSTSPQAGRPPSARAAGAVTSTAAPALPQEPSKKALLADYLARKNPNSGLVKALRLSAALEASTPTETPPEPARGARGPSPQPTGPRPQGMSRLLELFHDPVGGWKGRTPIGPIGGHGRHVHVAAGPKTTVAFAKLARQMGLHVGEHPKYGGVAPVHTKGSYHYRRKGQAIDVSGDPQKMKAYTQRILKLYGIPAR